MNVLQAKRLELLTALDAAKTKLERDKLGQFATAPGVSGEMVEYVLAHIARPDIRYLEPGFGTGTFFNSLLQQVAVNLTGDMHPKANRHQLTAARGYEVDPHYADPIADLYDDTQLDLRVEDYTEAKPEPFDLILCNPPCVRHHHMDGVKKVALADDMAARYKLRPPGLTGLYNYFIMTREAWLSDDGLAGWLVPSEFLDVNYGVVVKTFLLQKVTLTRIHLYRSENVQFDDALVSSAVVWYRKGKPAADHTIELSYSSLPIVKQLRTAA